MHVRIPLGEITLHRIVERESPYLEARTFFPDLSAEMLEANRNWMAPRYLEPGSDRLILSFQSYLIETRHHRILVDSCVGHMKPRPNRAVWHMQDNSRYIDTLQAAGVGPADIDFVMCTHLHVDHVGWNTRLDNGRWVPTFPNARYLFSARELQHWTERSAKEPEALPWIVDSVLPIVSAGRCQEIASTHATGDAVRCVPTPGHTIDHFSVELGADAARPAAFLTGDMLHSPIQLRYPDLGMASDFDSAQAGRSRRQVLERLAGTSTLFCTAHFPTPSVGQVVRHGDGFALSA